MELSLEKLFKDRIIVTFDEENRKYILSKGKVLTKNTLFNTLIECSDKDKVLIHKDSVFTYDQFEIIYRILNDEKLELSELKENQDIINFYMINTKDTISNAIDIETGKFLFCNTEAKYNEVLEFIKDNKLPYLPFKAVFANGFKQDLKYGDLNDDAYEIKNIPMYISFGEYDNLFLFKHLEYLTKNIDQTELYKYRKKHNKYDYDNDLFMYQGLNGFILQPDKSDLRQKIHLTFYHSFLKHLVSYDKVKKSETSKEYKVYCIDSDNKLFIHPSYNKKILAYLEEIDFYDSLIKESENKDKNIFSKTYNVQKWANDVEQHLMNISEVYGFVKCDDLA
jgi:hypothetical protein